MWKERGSENDLDPPVFFWNSPVMLRQQGSNSRESIIVTYIVTHAPTFVPKASSTSRAYVKKYTGKEVVARKHTYLYFRRKNLIYMLAWS